MEELKKEYEEQNNYGYLECPTCNSDKLISYGSYIRNVYICEYTTIIIIKRVKCKKCGKTHAIIPTFLKPYFNYESSFIDFCVVEKYENKKTNKEIEEIEISRQLIRKWIKRLNQYLMYIKTTFKMKVKDKISEVIFKEEFKAIFYQSNKLYYFQKI